MPARGAPGLVEAYNTSKCCGRSRELFRERPTHQQLAMSSVRANKHRVEQHAGFDGNRDDPFDGLLAARVRR